MTTNTSRIEQLQALIQRGATEGEREAARRALARVIAKAEKDTAHTGYQLPGRVYGAKATDRYIPLKDITAMMRADIALLRKLGKAKAAPGEIAEPNPIGHAPAAVRYGVRKEEYSGGGSIHIVVRNAPIEWAWHVSTNHPNYRPGVTVYEPTDALHEVGQALKGIHWSYNYDGSDVMTDYFDRKYHGGVEALAPNGYHVNIGSRRSRR